MKRIAFNFLIVLILFSAISSFSCIKQSKANVILIIIDTVRYDHMDYTGYKNITTPFISSLTKKGAIFPISFSSGSWTFETLASFYSGLPVGIHGCSHKEKDNYDSLPNIFPTIGEVFKNNGYETAVFNYGGNTGFYSSAFGYDRGINYNESDYFKGNLNNKLLDPYIGDPYYNYEADKYILNKALIWLNNQTKRNKPYFAIIHLTAGHDPYERKEPFCYSFISKEDFFSFKKLIKEKIGDVTTNIIGRFGAPYLENYPELKKYVISQYDSALLSTDQMISDFFYKLEDKHDTIFSIISDHGEGFVEHKESYQHGDWNPPYSENFRVPVIFFGKNIPEGKKINKTPFSSIDLMPTLLGLSKLKIPKSVLGNNYASHIYKKSYFPFNQLNKCIFMESYNYLNCWGIYENGFKYFTTLNSLNLINKYNFSFSPEGLFNLEKDTEEKQNNVFLYPDIARKLRLELEKKLLWKRRGWNVIIQGDNKINNYKIEIKTKGLKIDTENMDSYLTLHFFSEQNPFDIQAVLSNSFIPKKKKYVELPSFKNSNYYAEFKFNRLLDFDQSYILGAWIYSPQETYISLNLIDEKDEIISSLDLPISGNARTLVWNRFFTIEKELWEKIKDNKSWKLVLYSSKKGTEVKNVFFSPSNDWIRNMSINNNKKLFLNFQMGKGYMVLNFRTKELTDLPNIQFEINGKKVRDDKILKGQKLYNKTSMKIEDYIYYDLRKNIKILRDGTKKIYIYNIIDAFQGEYKENLKGDKLTEKDIEILKTLGYIK